MNNEPEHKKETTTSGPEIRQRSLHSSFSVHHSAFGRPVCRLGLATRGGTHLTVYDFHLALDRGVNFLNWCGVPDSLSRAIADLGPRRSEVMVCVQFEARTAREAEAELKQILTELN